MYFIEYQYKEINGVGTADTHAIFGYLQRKGCACLRKGAGNYGYAPV